MKSGYHLTPEEEAIVRGKIPDSGEQAAPDESEKANENESETEKTGVGKAWKALFPLMIALGMMIGIAYLFLYLLNGPAPEKQPGQAELSATETTGTATVSGEQTAAFTEILALTEEESAAFWPLYTRFCQEMQQVRRNRAEWLGSTPDEQSYDAFLDAYLSVFDEHKRIFLRFSEAFAALLGEERTVALLLLHEKRLSEILP